MVSDRGVVYLLCGAKHAERMAVSWLTLRDHWQGPVTVGVTDDDCQAVAERAKGLDIEVRRVPLSKARRHSAYLNKTLVPQWTPYDESVFLDGDTMIVAPIDDLFGRPLVITSFGEWQTQGRRMSGRINRWRGRTAYIDALVDRQLHRPYPAINTGVFAFRRGLPFLSLWHTVTKAGAGLHMTDELAMQLLHSEIEECLVMDDRWNCSPIYGTHSDDVKIWHFHGGKHPRREAGKTLWAPAFDRAYEQNVCGLQEWAGTYDAQVRQHLEGGS